MKTNIENMFHFQNCIDYDHIVYNYRYCCKCSKFQYCAKLCFDIFTAITQFYQYHNLPNCKCDIFCNASYFNTLVIMLIDMTHVHLTSYDYDDFFPQLTPFHLHLYVETTMF